MVANSPMKQKAPTVPGVETTAQPASGQDATNWHFTMPDDLGHQAGLYAEHHAQDEIAAGVNTTDPSRNPKRGWDSTGLPLTDEQLDVPSLGQWTQPVTDD